MLLKAAQPVLRQLLLSTHSLNNKFTKYCRHDLPRPFFDTFVQQYLPSTLGGRNKKTPMSVKRLSPGGTPSAITLPFGLGRLWQHNQEGQEGGLDPQTATVLLRHRWEWKRRIGALFGI